MFWCLPCEHLKILKNGPVYLESSPKMGTLFWKNDPLKMGVDFEAQAAHPRPNQI